MVMNLSLVNYRGSGGFGQDSVFSLLGKIGTQEVRDVHVSSKLCQPSCQEVFPNMGTWVHMEIGSMLYIGVFQDVFISCEFL